MIKIIRFIGTLIIFLANVITYLNTFLKFVLFLGILIGIFVGVLIGVFDLISPDYSVYGHLWLDIVAVVIGAGLLYLTWDKTRTQEREYNEKLEKIRNHDINE